MLSLLRVQVTSKTTMAQVEVLMIVDGEGVLDIFMAIGLRVTWQKALFRNAGGVCVLMDSVAMST